MDSLWLWTIGTGALVVVSFLAIIASIVFQNKMSDKLSQICVLLLPLECCIIFFGLPFFLCLCFFLSHTLY